MSHYFSSKTASPIKLASETGSPIKDVPGGTTQAKTFITGFDEVLGTDKPIIFRGKLEIPGSHFVIPEQDFKGVFSEANVTFENLPVNAWPKIRVELMADPVTGTFNVKSFQVRTSEDSADGEIFYTRVHWMLSNIGRCSLHIEGLAKNINFAFERFSQEEEERLLYRAKIYRKLKFIEWVFRRKFALPQEVSADLVRAIDFVYRGITEGEFVIRGGEIKLQLESSEIDLASPTFDGPGSLRYDYTEKIHDLFNYGLEVGPSTVILKHAELADPNVVRQIRQGYQGPIWVKFSVLDHQINVRLDNYASRSKKQRQDQLKRFKHESLRNEPEELVRLLDEPLAADVSAEEANLIAMGWTQYNQLPDRYCPQEPLINQETNHWQIPIYLVYADGQGGPVGELVINKRTGEIVTHTPIEELRSKGRILAQAILHA
jgi:hypothetical protein